MRPGLVLVALVVAAGCLTPIDRGDEGPDEPDVEPPEGPDAFLEGIYYAAPSLDGGPGHLVRIGGGLERSYEVTPVGFDLHPDRLVDVRHEEGIVVVRPDGSESVHRVDGIDFLARPSFSPDGSRVAVQALEPGVQIGTPEEDLNIYVVDLADGSSERLSFLPVNEESPEWVPGSSRVAYSSFDPEQGVDVHVVDVETGDEVLRIADAGDLHMAVSDDGSRLVVGPWLRVYDLTTGALVADLKQAALDGLSAAGYAPESEHDGAFGQGAFPLDADFSPDGEWIVFDGAAERGDEHGFLVMRMRVDGTGFEVAAGLVPVDPAMGNENNFSQLNPVWI